MLCKEVAYGTVIPTITLNPMNGQKQTPRCQENRKKLKKVLELQITTATNNWENYGRNSTSLIGATVLAHGIFGDNQGPSLYYVSKGSEKLQSYVRSVLFMLT